MPPRKRLSQSHPATFAPLYGEKEARLILRFLASMTLDMMKGIDGLTEFYGKDVGSKLARKHIEGYARFIDAYRFAITRLVQKQRHLIESDELDIQRIIRIWKLPTQTLYRLERLGIYVPTMIVSKQKEISDGQQQESMQNGNGETPVMKISSD